MFIFLHCSGSVSFQRIVGSRHDDDESCNNIITNKIGTFVAIDGWSKIATGMVMQYAALWKTAA